MDLTRFEVPIERLRWRCDPGLLSFQCTDELVPLQEFIGQDRAIRAIEFGLAVDKPGYNIFVAGMTGTGRTSIVKAHLEKLVAERKDSGQAPTPCDWCYLHNFDDADRPRILRLPAGEGKQLKARLERLLEDLKN